MTWRRETPVQWKGEQYILALSNRDFCEDESGLSTASSMAALATSNSEQVKCGQCH